MSNFIIDPYIIATAGGYETTTYKLNDDNDTDSNLKIYANARLVNASRVVSGGALDGFKMTEMKCLCQKITTGGTPTNSTIYGRIWNTDDNSMDVLETSSTLSYDTDGVSDSEPYTELTFAFTGDVTLSANYKIGIYCSISGGTSSKAIVLRANNTTADNSDVIMTEFNPDEKWNDDTPKNLWQAFS